MIRGVQVGLKMASGDVIKRLETRAVAAEQLIKMLRAQIQEIKSFSTNQNSSGSNEEKEIESLTIENANLKKKIMEQKNLLISAEAKMGIKQVQTGKYNLFIFIPIHFIGRLYILSLSLYHYYTTIKVMMYHKKHLKMRPQKLPKNPKSNTLKTKMYLRKNQRRKRKKKLKRNHKYRWKKLRLTLEGNLIDVHA